MPRVTTQNTQARRRGREVRNASAYDDFYRSTSPRLLRYCYALTGELGEAEDVAQET